MCVHIIMYLYVSLSVTTSLPPAYFFGKAPAKAYKMEVQSSMNNGKGPNLAHKKRTEFLEGGFPL